MLLLLHLYFQNKLMCFCLSNLKTHMPYMNTCTFQAFKLGSVSTVAIQYLPISAPMSDLSLFSSMLPCRSSSFSKGVKRLRSPIVRFSLTNSSLLPSFTMPTFYNQTNNIKKEILSFVNAFTFVQICKQSIFILTNVL